MSDTMTAAITDDTRIRDLDVSVRLGNILATEGLSTIGDVRRADWDRLKMARSMGRNTWREFVAFTVTYGIVVPKATPEKIANQALCDHFAGLAMQGLVSHNGMEFCWDEYAAEAYAIASAMIAERNRLMNEKP